MGEYSLTHCKERWSNTSLEGNWLIIMASLPSGVEVEWLREYSYYIAETNLQCVNFFRTRQLFFLQPKILTLPAIFALETCLLNGIKEVRNIQE